MALKINNVTVIGDDKYINAITATDATTKTTFKNSYKAINHSFSVQNSAGTTLATYYAANTA